MSSARWSLTGQDRGSGELSSCSRVPPFIYWGYGGKRRGMTVKVSICILCLLLISQVTLTKVRRASLCSKVPTYSLGCHPVHHSNMMCS